MIFQAILLGLATAAAANPIDLLRETQAIEDPFTIPVYKPQVPTTGVPSFYDYLRGMKYYDTMRVILPMMYRNYMTRYMMNLPASRHTHLHYPEIYHKYGYLQQPESYGKFSMPYSPEYLYTQMQHYLGKNLYNQMYLDELYGNYGLDVFGQHGIPEIYKPTVHDNMWYRNLLHQYKHLPFLNRRNFDLDTPIVKFDNIIPKTIKDTEKELDPPLLIKDDLIRTIKPIHVDQPKLDEKLNEDILLKNMLLQRKLGFTPSMVNVRGFTGNF